jgi:hypothetical protein
MEKATHLCKLGRHTGPAFLNELAENCIGTDIAFARGMQAKAIAVARATTRRKLYLVMTNRDSEHPTNIDNLRPDSQAPADDSSGVGHSVVIPRDAAVPSYDSERRGGSEPPLVMPENPSVLERAAFRILQGVEALNRTDFDGMIRASEKRMADRADEREKALNANLDVVQETVRNMNKAMALHSTTIDAVADLPRQIGELRTQLDKMQREWDEAKASGKFASTG